MSYKEIQVPSSEIIAVYERVLNVILPLKEQAENKTKENIRRAQEFELSELNMYKALCEAIRSYTTNALDRVLLDPGKPYFDLLQSNMRAYSNPVAEYIYNCQKMLEAAKLANFLVLTEEQVQDFNQYKSGKIEEKTYEWLAYTETYVSQYSQEEIDKIMYLPRGKKELSNSNSEPEQYNRKEDSYFWKALVITTGLILLAWAAISAI